MEQKAFSLLHESEQSWWYRGRAAVIRNVLGKKVSDKRISILDFGAGYGGMAQTLSRYGDVSAYEPDPLVRGMLADRGYKAIYNTSGDALDRSYTLVALFDTLEHIEDDRAFLRQARTAIESDGKLVLTVPAMPFLWSTHDKEHHHYRRYTKSSLRAVLEDSGYELVRISYWNMFLFIPAALTRLLGRSGESSFRLPRAIDSFFYTLVRIEAFFIQFASLPFGVSLVAVARKAGPLRAPSKLTARLKFLARYGISGVTGGAIQTLVLFIWVSLLGFQNTYLLGLVFGFVLALIVSFILQKYWAFRDHESHRTPRQLLSYAAVAISGLALNAILLIGAKTLFARLAVDFFHIWYLVVQVAIICIVSLSNFCMNFLFTFRHARQRRSWER